MAKENNYDLIVVGGGFAGVCSAMAAAKHGLNVLLIEKTNALGGAAVHALVMPFMEFTTRIPESNERQNLSGNLFLEIICEMEKITGGVKDKRFFDDEVLKLVLNRMALKYNVHLLFDTVVYDVTLKNDKISSIKAFGKSSQMEFFADYFIDATGDAELAMLAGCPYVLGRSTDHLCQPMTLCFRMSGVDIEKYRKKKSQVNSLYRQLKEKGMIKNPREDILSFNTLNDGILHFNSTRIVRKNPTDPFDVTNAEIEAREQVFELYNFLKENAEGFENAKIISTAIQIGIRESRKIVGEYTLTEDDLKTLTYFEDAIAVGNYDIDIHNPEGEGTSHYYFKNGEWYTIPYRCLIPKGKNNLLVAGRCISATHAAQASFRIMPFCAEIGHAAGVAISVAHKSNVSVQNVNVKAVQGILRNEGFVI